MDSYGDFLDAMYRILATDHVIAITQEGQGFYEVKVKSRRGSMTHSMTGPTVTHLVAELADVLAPGAK